MLRIVILCMFSIFSSLELLATPAIRLLDSVHNSYSMPCVIGKNEWKELQLDRLINSLDRTQTSFGRWGLAHLLQPVSDKKELLQRQKIVSYLVEHENVLHHLQKQLSQIKQSEDFLLSYWDTKDQLNNHCDKFYYEIPGLKNYLNKSNVALNIGVATQMGLAAKNLLISLCLSGISDEFLAWHMTEQKDFSFKRGIKKGLEQPLMQHSFALDVLANRDSQKYSAKDYAKVVLKGSFGDRYELILQGCNFDATQFGLSEDFSITAQKSIGLAAKGLAFGAASLQTLTYDYFWGTSLVSIAQQIYFMHKSLKGLTERIFGVTSCFNAMSHIIDDVQNGEHIFGKYVYCDKNRQIAMSIMHDLITKQSSYKQLYKYSPGYVLCMHKEIKQIKSTVIPLLQTIALIDAFCSIAQLYKEHENKNNAFCFVDFVDMQEPYMAYKDAWLSLLSDKQAVSNDLYLGKDYAGKIVITGPNGGGKSTLLKTYGVGAVLAQGWGIVPASSAQQTIFSSIKTGLAPHEDLQEGLSTFMAEKKCMEQLDSHIKRTHKGYNALILIDEPYKGTVDDESAKRIYNFGMSIASNPHALVCIATHVKKPILLEPDTHGIFANYHVEINEEPYGIFKRLFTLKQGPAHWWFENEGQRGRFIDWISL